MKFLIENVVTRFRCPNILISNQVTHVVNQLIEELTDEFQIQHRITTPYHPQENGVVKAFNKILENALTKVCNTRRMIGTRKFLQYYGHVAQHVRS